MLNIVILGTGCPNCIRLENLCKEIVAEKNLEATIEKVTDMNKFGDYGVMLTPGLVVNEKVLSQGKIPVKNTLESWLEKEAGN
ncbi:MAG TPA: thioredoxin family protein [Bacteroidales bacterium]|nr:thioredoxin family protein [Bacteroidales bacterium]